MRKTQWGSFASDQLTMNSSLVRRQLDPERAAAARRAFDADFAAEGLGEVLHDREAEAGAAELARAGFVDAVEAFENAFLIGGFDADAGVGDGKDEARAKLRAEARWVLARRGASLLDSVSLHEIVTVPPSGVYLIALSTRLSRISRRPSRSARTRASVSAAAWLGSTTIANAFRLRGRPLAFDTCPRRLPPRRPSTISNG